MNPWVDLKKIFFQRALDVAFESLKYLSSFMVRYQQRKYPNDPYIMNLC